MTLPWAVLLGLVAIGVLVSIAVFLALRPRSSERQAPVAGEPTGETGARADAPLIPAPSAANVSATPLSGASANATGSLAAQHAALVSACWLPLSRKPAMLTWSLHVSFDARGKQMAKMMLTSVGQVRPDATECLAGALIPLAIDPTNAPATVDLQLTLP